MASHVRFVSDETRVEVDDRGMTVLWPGGIRRVEHGDVEGMLKLWRLVLGDEGQRIREASYRRGFAAGHSAGWHEGYNAPGSSRRAGTPKAS